MNKAKELEEQKNKTTKRIEKYWKDHSKDNKINSKTIADVFNENWKDTFHCVADEEKVNSIKNDLISRINEEVKEEQESNANYYTGEEKWKKRKEGLNKKLQTLRGELRRTGGPIFGNFSKDVEKWFEELVDYISDEDNKFLKKLFKGISRDEIEKTLSELEKEKNLKIEQKEGDFEKKVFILEKWGITIK